MATPHAEQKEKLNNRRRSLYFRIIFVDIFIATIGFILGATGTTRPFESITISLLFAILAHLLIIAIELSEGQILVQTESIEAIERIQKTHDFQDSLEEAPGLKKLIVSISNQMFINYQESVENNIGFFYNKQLENLKTSFEELQSQYASRTITLEGAPCITSTINCYKSIKETVFATSFAHDDFWERDESSEYFNANGSALNRGIKITRIFIFEDTSRLLDVGFQENVLKRQIKLGPPGNRLTLKLFFRPLGRAIDPLWDVSLFDGKLLTFWELRGGRDFLDKATITWNPLNLSKCIRMRDYLLPRSTLLENIADIPDIINEWNQNNY